MDEHTLKLEDKIKELQRTIEKGEVLGHSNISITLDTYSHILPNMQKEAARAMEDRSDPPDSELSPEVS